MIGDNSNNKLTLKEKRSELILNRRSSCDLPEKFSNFENIVFETTKSKVKNCDEIMSYPPTIDKRKANIKSPNSVLNLLIDKQKTFSHKQLKGKNILVQANLSEQIRSYTSRISKPSQEANIPRIIEVIVEEKDKAHLSGAKKGKTNPSLTERQLKKEERTTKEERLEFIKQNNATKDFKQNKLKFMEVPDSSKKVKKFGETKNTIKDGNSQFYQVQNMLTSGKNKPDFEAWTVNSFSRSQRDIDLSH